MLRDISLHILDLAQNSITAKANLIEITIATVENEKYLSLTIQDNGFGMTAEFLARVTDPFTTSRSTRQVGMGIPFFKLACEQASGEFMISSVVNEGTVLSGSFEIDNIDRLPLGDIGDTFVFLISFAADVRFVLNIKSSKGEFKLDTQEIKEQIEDTPITEHEILQWIKDYINENVENIFGGVLNEIFS